MYVKLVGFIMALKGATVFTPSELSLQSYRLLT